MLKPGVAMVVSTSQGTMTMSLPGEGCKSQFMIHAITHCHHSLPQPEVTGLFLIMRKVPLTRRHNNSKLARVIIIIQLQRTMV